MQATGMMRWPSQPSSAGRGWQIPESRVSAGHGRQGIEKAYAHWFKNWEVRNYLSTVDRVISVDNQIGSTGRLSDTFQGIEGGRTEYS
jgi:hypothetical protein